MAKERSGLLTATVMLCLSTISNSTLAENPAYISFGNTELDKGRVIWLNNCETCHGYGIAGAPIPMHADEWRPRLKKPVNMLYDHAINGFIGPDDTIMPARGNNPALSDSSVKLAVDYMMALANYYINVKEEEK